MMHKELKIKPYARLLTMLGDQLIKNELIAVIELIKNSYDADATWVKVTFKDFDENFLANENSKIIIEDDGDGMSQKTIEEHWLNPATPNKLNIKKERPKTKKGRVLQGEKGIGRFAIFKLGKHIKIYTKELEDHEENIITYDFRKYDNDFISYDGKDETLYLEDLSVEYDRRIPKNFGNNKKTRLGSTIEDRPEKGTIIVISNLKTDWKEYKVRNIYDGITNLIPIFKDYNEIKNDNNKPKDKFDVFIYKDKIEMDYRKDYIEKLNTLIENKPVFKIEKGKYNEAKTEFSFLINGIPKVLNLNEPELRGLRVCEKYFGDSKATEIIKTNCGSFHFSFYIFDFSVGAMSKYKLDRKDKEILKEHRIYLYRDGIRVYPYGEKDDDWLQIDVYRGTISAGHFLSNDQVVGHIDITQESNPKLIDKTNREGLIEEGSSTSDLITLIQILLSYIRLKPYKQYRTNIEQLKASDVVDGHVVQKEIDILKEELADNTTAYKKVIAVEKLYTKERNLLKNRAEVSEELAGVGLSVEAATHDIMSVMHKSIAYIDKLQRDLGSNKEIDKELVESDIMSLRGWLSFIEDQLTDVQLLFKSSKQRRKNIKVINHVEKTTRIYRNLLEKYNIDLIVEEIGQPLIAKITDAVLLQVLINLLDNSIYWLNVVNSKIKEIKITLDSNRRMMIFSDNGPGINKDDEPYIFTAFYSGKEEGRGLGMYIAKQLLERIDYTIRLADIKSEKILPGANFVVDFNSEK